MPNYLLPTLNAYFKEIMSIEGNLNLSIASLNAHKTFILEGNDDSFYVSGITTYRDLSIAKGKDNLFTPQYDHYVSKKDIEENIEILISKYCCFSISQAYEVFESYFIDVLTEFLFVNHKRLADVGIASGNIVLVKDALRLMIKKMQNGKKGNNSGLVKMVRTLSPHFAQYEEINLWELNMSVWFDLLSRVRHILVHNRQVIPQRLFNHIKAEKLEDLFNRQFPRKVIDGKISIFLNQNLSSDIINWLGSYAHLIFTGLSIEAKLSLHVPQYQQPMINPSRILVRQPYNS